MYKQPTFHTIFLNLTDACNLRCTYCFEHKHSHYMTLDIAKDTMSLLNTINKDKQQDCSVVFFGGEPLLCWESIIKPLVLWTEAQIFDTKISFSITSNGTLLTSDKIQFMVEHNISYMLSMDGDENSQNCCRKYIDGSGTYDCLEPKLREIAEKLRPIFHGVIVPQTSGKLWSNIQFAKSYGFPQAYFTPDWFTEWSSDDIETLACEVHKYSIYFINSYQQGKEPYEFSAITKYIKDLHVLVDFQHTHKLPERWGQFCGLCMHSACIDYDGSIYGCQQAPTLPVLDNIYKVGDIYNGIDIDKHQRLVDAYHESLPKSRDITQCQDCLYRPICINRCCHSNCYITNNDLHTLNEIGCVWNQILCEEAVYISNALVSKNNESFQKKFDIYEIIDENNIKEALK